MMVNDDTHEVEDNLCVIGGPIFATYYEYLAREWWVIDPSHTVFTGLGTIRGRGVGPKQGGWGR